MIKNNLKEDIIKKSSNKCDENVRHYYFNNSRSIVLPKDSKSPIIINSTPFYKKGFTINYK